MQPHNPIQHVVIIVKENHTFDNYFGTFPGANGDAALAHAPDPPPSDPPHDHAAWLRRAIGAVRQQYHATDLPVYFAYARQYTLCDNYFTVVASQSEPNHLMLIAADSPIIDNASPKRTYQPQAPFNLPSLPESLAEAKLSWKSYGDPAFNYFNHIQALAGSPQIVPWSEFDADAAAGRLPNVAWVYADGLHDEHPPYGANAGKPTVSLGEQWTAERVSQVAKGRLWASTVIFITWDDWGGWYDHVNPPLKETWKGGGPPKAGYAGSQFSFGPRVGCLVLSPYARPGYISKTFHSHLSLVKFCEVTFGLGPLTVRDAGADDMADCFNFKQTPLAPPKLEPGPAPLPKPTPKPKPKPKPRAKPASRGATKRQPAAKKTARKTATRRRS